MVEFSIFFRLRAYRHLRRSVSITFSRNLCKKVQMLSWGPSLLKFFWYPLCQKFFLRKFVWYPPVGNSWIRACYSEIKRTRFYPKSFRCSFAHRHVYPIMRLKIYLIVLSKVGIITFQKWDSAICVAAISLLIASKTFTRDIKNSEKDKN